MYIYTSLNISGENFEARGTLNDLTKSFQSLYRFYRSLSLKQNNSCSFLDFLHRVHPALQLLLIDLIIVQGNEV